MIFLNENTQKLTINRHFSENCVKIELFNRYTKQTTTFSDLVDVSKSSYFYEFEGIDVSNLIDGEYIITLFDENDNDLEQLLAVKGEYKKQVSSYNKENNQRKIYER